MLPVRVFVLRDDVVIVFIGVVCQPRIFTSTMIYNFVILIPRGVCTIVRRPTSDGV